MFFARTLLFGLLCLFISVNSYSQSSIPEFGDIPDRHLKVNSFQGDSSLGAIILFDRGYVSFNSDLEIEFERHRRIKIMSKKGFDWATVTIPYYAKGDRQAVERIDATSYNVMANGEIESKDVGRRDIFEEEVSNRWKQKKFTFPAVEPGTIIEYKYRIESKSLMDFPDWDFQHSIPTLTSQYEARVPEWFRYMFYYQGFEELDYQNQEQYPGVKTIRFGASSTRRNRNVQLRYERTDYMWGRKDVPALKEEPYMSSVKNFKSKLYVQLRSIKYPNSAVEPVLTNWKQVAKELREHESFGQKLESGERLKKVISNLTETDTSNFDRMKSIYDYITRSVKWNDKLGFLAERSPEEVLKQKLGTGVEINLLLVQMLREAGIQAYPVLLSTRDNGRVQSIYPVMSQFNHVIAAAVVEGDTYYLDAKSDLRPYNLLPVQDLNGSALVVTSNAFQWADLKSTAPSVESFAVNVTMDKNGKLRGDLTSRLSGYPALQARSALEDSEADDRASVVKDLWFDNYPDTKLDSISVENKDAYEKTLLISTKFDLNNTVQSSNEQYYYLNPMVVLREQNNPFKLEKRKFPVVFPSNFQRRIVVNITLPEGVSIDEIPESRMVGLQNKDGYYRRIIQKSKFSKHDLTMIYNIYFKKHIFQPEGYEHLKSFWQDLVNAHSEMIVLKRENQQQDLEVSSNE